MPRKCLLTPRFTRHTNPFHQANLHSALHKCFEADILPAGLDQFSRKDIEASLYSSRRRWVDYVEYGSEEESEQHESYLHYLFWDADLPVPLCIVGPVGTGKSTLVNFYLRCYCPERRQADFAKKLIIRINATTLGDQSARANLYYKTQDAIESALKGRSDVLERIGNTRDVYQWVTTALKLITTATGGKDAPFEYIVLVVDNLEQCPVESQHSVIREIQSWQELEQVQFWRIIIPLWPSSLKALRSLDFSLLRGAVEFDIGELLTSTHYDRVRILEGKLVSIVANNDSASSCRQFILYALEQLQALRLLSFIRRLSNGDMRRELRLVGDVLASDHLHHIAKDRLGKEKNQMSHYDVLYSLLLGRYDGFVHDVSRVGNIFCIGHDTAFPRDMLIGWHLLSMLNVTRHRRSVYHLLGRLGYSPDNIARGLENLRLMNVFHDLMANIAGDVVIEPHAQVVTEYRDLACDVAYIDAIAPVTPVETTPFLREMEAHPRKAGFDFVARVECSLVFIEAVRRDELEFLDVETCRPDLDASAFHETKRGLRLERVWRKMAKAYCGRLTGLWLSRSMPSVLETQWKDWLERPVMTQWRSEPELL